MSDRSNADWNSIGTRDFELGGLGLDPKDNISEGEKARQAEKKEKVRSQTRERQKRFRERNKAAMNEVHDKIRELKEMIETEKKDNRDLQVTEQGLLWAVEFCDETVKLLQLAGDSLADESPQTAEASLDDRNTGINLRAETHEEASALVIQTSESCPEGCLRGKFSQEALESFLKILQNPKIQDLQEIKEIQTLVDATAVVLGNAAIENGDELRKMTQQVSDDFFRGYWRIHSWEMRQLFIKYGFSFDTPDSSLDNFEFKSKEDEQEFLEKAMRMARQAVLMIGFFIRNEFHPFNALFSDAEAMASQSDLQIRWRTIAHRMSVRPEQARDLYQSYLTTNENNLMLYKHHLEILSKIPTVASMEVHSAVDASRKALVLGKVTQALEDTKSLIEQNFFDWLGFYSKSVDFIQIQLMVAASYPSFPNMVEIMKEIWLANQG